MDDSFRPADKHRDARTEVEQQDVAQLLAAIVASSEDAIISKDLNGIVKSWNLGAQRLFGYLAEEAVGKSITMLIPPDRLSEEDAILSRIRRGERVEHYETIRRHKDGSLVDISLTVSPVRDKYGKIVGASKIARDISERKRAEKQQRRLLGEMQHRVRNTLATVQAIATQTLKNITQAERESFLGRLQSLASAHDLLALDNWKGASVGAVVTRALAPFKEKHSSRIVSDGPPGIFLDAGKALTLTMALYELATNASKYGALSSAAGTVNVSWEMSSEGSPRLLLTWRESGGPKAEPPLRKGFGSLLIERTLHDNSGGGAKFDYAPEGLTCVITLGL